MKFLTVSCLSMFSAALMAAEEPLEAPSSALPENSGPPNASAEDTVSLWDGPAPLPNNPACALTGKTAVRVEYYPLVSAGGGRAGGNPGTTEFSFMAIYDGASTHESLKLYSGHQPFDPAGRQGRYFETNYRF